MPIELTRRGQEDLENLLLPRSTGTLFVLRSLASRMPDCAFYDLTIGYPGVPLASCVSGPTLLDC